MKFFTRFQRERGLMTTWITKHIQEHIKPEDTVLDIGCGIMGATSNMNCKSILAVDAWKPYLDTVKYKYPTMKMDIEKGFNASFIGNSYDIVMAIDFVEHITDKEIAFAVIEHMETVARKKVIIFTTEGYVEQKDGLAWAKGNVKYQSHKIGITTNEFKMMGYDVSIYPAQHLGKEINTILAVKDVS